MEGAVGWDEVVETMVRSKMLSVWVWDDVVVGVVRE